MVKGEVHFVHFFSASGLVRSMTPQVMLGVKRAASSSSMAVKVEMPSWRTFRMSLR